MNYQKKIESLRQVGGEIQTESFSIGDGQWSLEVMDLNGGYLFELVGSNGTREEASDLFAELALMLEEASQHE